MQFHQMPIHRDIARGLKDMGFVRPTPIQAQTILPALEGRDIMACASTGSGKTAAFIIPMLQKLIDKPRGKTRALVLTPTRELAAQVHEHCSDLATHTPVTSAAIYGGVGMGPQEHALRSGVEIVVATPGRLLDHMRSSYARFDQLEFLVLDEADRMLDMGFLPEIRRILRQLPKQRQTMLFSATMPEPIEALAHGMLHDPERIQVERRSAPAVLIVQCAYPVKSERKSELLLALLARNVIKDALVFTRTKHRADRLSLALKRAGVKASRIHGDRSQAQRTAALADFKNGKIRVLVATDIAARGIDVVGLGHVVNYDVPRSPEDYIHRVGRTGRAEAVGDAITFVSPQEEKELQTIERRIAKKLPRTLLEDFDAGFREGESTAGLPPPFSAPPPPSKLLGRRPRRTPRQMKRQ